VVRISLGVVGCINDFHFVAQLLEFQKSSPLRLPWL
jgi:hypothetical protein